MNQDLIQALKELEREKGISFETILAGLEEALAAAYKTWKRGFGIEHEPDGARVQLDPETGEMRVWVQELDPDTEEVLSEKEETVPDEFMGRIAAQTAKQVIYQKLRDAEREMTYEEFAGREGDIVTGIIQQDQRKYTLLDLGKVEALLPQAEQVPSEPYRHGERLKAYIVEVRKTTKGPQIVVSRTHPGPAARAVRAGGARGGRGHRGDQGRGARAGAPFEDRRDVARARGRPGRRVRRHQGVPRAHGRERAARREDRRGRVDGRPAQVRRERPAARPR